MDTPLTPPDALVRPWRMATLAASLVAAVELVALIALAFLLLAKPLSRAMEQRATAATVTHTASHSAHALLAKLMKPAPVGKLKLSRHATGVLVLNGNGRAGAAHAEASRLQSLGYRIRGAGNAARSDYATTVVMFKRGYAAEGHRLARDLHVSVVGPLDGITPAQLDGGQLVVVLGAR